MLSALKLTYEVFIIPQKCKYANYLLFPKKLVETTMVCRREDSLSGPAASGLQPRYSEGVPSSHGLEVMDVYCGEDKPSGRDSGHHPNNVT